MKGKPEYEITKTRYEVEREKIKEKLDSECPECGYTETYIENPDKIKKLVKKDK